MVIIKIKNFIVKNINYITFLTVCITAGSCTGTAVGDICINKINFRNLYLLIISLVCLGLSLLREWYYIKSNNKIFTKIPNKHSKFIYLSHPYGGKVENLKSCNDYFKALQPELYKTQGKVLISPLHACGCLYKDMDYTSGLNLSIEYLKLCEEMWVCPGWEDSIGCTQEIAYCMEHNVPIKYLPLKNF